jgi:hypothetical protein
VCVCVCVCGGGGQQRISVARHILALSALNLLCALRYGRVVHKCCTGSLVLL